MKADILKVESLLSSGEKKEYVIPAYQRPYRWDIDQAEQLVLDILDSYESGEDNYFIGSMICIKEDDNKYEVVDGQQRLITLTLIMHQLSRITTNQKIRSDLEKRVVCQDIYSKNDSKQTVVRVRQMEQSFYSKILEGGEILDSKTDTQKVFLNNWKKIREYLPPDGSDIRNLSRHLLQNVSVVFVEVDDRASSFRLFNVLNNRGMPLNDADLLKNLLLEKVAEHHVQTERIKEDWQQMEDMIGEKNLHNFLRLHILSEKKNRDRVIKIGNKKASTFDYYGHQLKNEFGGDAGALLKKIVRSAGHYYSILNEDLCPANTIELLKNFKMAEWITASMAFLNKGYSKEEFLEFINLFEQVYMQSWLANETMGKRDKACYIAIESINTGDSFVDIMEKLKGESDNDRLEKSLDVEIFYDSSRRQIINLVKAVLIRLDRERHDNSVQKKYTGKISVEHILPQNMKDQYWNDRFTEEEHEALVHTLGNLTLISGVKNSAAKNFDFDRKKAAYQKLTKCSFDITKELNDYSDWNKEAIRCRHKKLKDEIKALWAVK